jgi:phospholipid/cholesterol/gamma-HCH transport system ATP-binding protein
MASKALIELKKISKSFGNKKILDQTDLTIHRGDALAIIGPSGTGKSTILRIIAGLEAPDAGEIYIDGQKRIGLIDDAPDPIGIGMVFQQSALFDSLTVGENVGFLLYQHSRLKEDRIKKLVEEKLEMVGLPGVAHLYPSELSGGMRKRVSFARAIMANPERQQDNPEVILYDEPTAGLDPIASTVIENLVRDLQAAKAGGSTYIMVTHQQSTIRNTADRIVFLYHGQVQWEGTVADVETTTNPLVQQFFSGRVQGPIQVVG